MCSVQYPQHKWFARIFLLTNFISFFRYKEPKQEHILFDEIATPSECNTLRLVASNIERFCYDGDVSVAAAIVVNVDASSVTLAAVPLTA